MGPLTLSRLLKQMVPHKMRRIPEMPKRSKPVRQDARQSKGRCLLAAGCLQIKDITLESLDDIHKSERSYPGIMGAVFAKVYCLCGI